MEQAGSVFRLVFPDRFPRKVVEVDPRQSQFLIPVSQPHERFELDMINYSSMFFYAKCIMIVALVFNKDCDHSVSTVTKVIRGVKESLQNSIFESFQIISNHYSFE